jgi:hypothetical protein
MAVRVCSRPGCPNLIPSTGFCPHHARAAEKQRGRRQARGYTAEHDRLRRQWAPRVATGAVQCWRCHTYIDPTEPWDLGHDDDNRYITHGPEHANRCNRAAAGRASHRT